MAERIHIDEERMISQRATSDGRIAVTRRGFVTRLFRWHAAAERTLAIRDAATPWEVLVAEVMSQQTGIERVGPYWRSFIAQWPTPAALATVGTRELLEAWAGLGYNRRALALRAAAERIVIDHGGVVPRTVEQLEQLPGIGRYTARAIAATAFGVPVAPLDVNVARVIGRATGCTSSSLQDIANALVAPSQPRRWLNAVMDLAATVCTKAAPRCPECPVRAMCVTQGGAQPAPREQTQVPFPQTRRWLRGRLLARFREGPHDQWHVLPDRLGTHDGKAIVAAAEGLARDGFIEMGDRGARIRV